MSRGGMSEEHKVNACRILAAFEDWGDSKATEAAEKILYHLPHDYVLKDGNSKGKKWATKAMIEEMNRMKYVYLYDWNDCNCARLPFSHTISLFRHL